MGIKEATLEDLDRLAPLFDAYRQFYGQPSDLQLASAFLAERLERRDSAIFLARDGAGGVAGFTQLYPSFTSTGCARIYILNDLFVAPPHRGRGLARTLLQTAAEFGRRMGAVRLTLSTGVENRSAQTLYEREGWARNEAFYTYNLALG